jgi:hypothetical protein
MDERRQELCRRLTEDVRNNREWLLEITRAGGFPPGGRR